MTITSQPANDNYRDSWDRIFGKSKDDAQCVECKKLAPVTSAMCKKCESYTQEFSELANRIFSNGKEER